MLLGPCSLGHANAATTQKASSALSVLISQWLTFTSWPDITQAVCRDSEDDQWKTLQDLGSAGHTPYLECDSCALQRKQGRRRAKQELLTASPAGMTTRAALMSRGAVSHGKLRQYPYGRH